jgi:hypothetical protein
MMGRDIVPDNMHSKIPEFFWQARQRLNYRHGFFEKGGQMHGRQQLDEHSCLQQLLLGSAQQCLRYKSWDVWKYV